MITKNLKTQNAVQAFLISVLVIFGLFAWQGHVGFNLWDEGYLWYGVQRVLLGEVPMRDFMSYDPGRYYWSAALLSIWGDNGILPLRFTVAIFQALGLFAGLYLIIKSVKKNDLLYFVLCAITLALWMLPRHKLFDISISIFMMATLTYLVENPKTKGFFITGVVVGLIAIFGRNHGVYAVVGSFVAMVWLAINREHDITFFKGFCIWLLGVVIGYSPLIIMLVVVPGFALAFWESIKFLFEIKTTNLALPIPWPWHVNLQGGFTVKILKEFLIGIFFVGIALFAILSLIGTVWLKWLKKQQLAAVVAISFLATPYMHYAFSRADIGHLALGIFPFLLGVLILLAQQKNILKWPLAVLFCSMSFLATNSSHPGWACFKQENCVPVEVSGNNLVVPPGVASDIQLLNNLSSQYTPNGESFLVTPFWPGAYALLERESPMWANYTVYSRTAKTQNEEIERVKKFSPNFVLIIDIALDGREDLRFKNSNWLVYKYINENYSPVFTNQNKHYEIYKKLNN